MKIFKLFKSIPFLLTLFFILLINVSNNKEYTKLKILIWDTPELTLGSYIAISTGAGFILSYIISNNIAIGYTKLSTQKIKYKINDHKLYEEDNDVDSYDNTLIQRDPKYPSPTINAIFRVIGKTERKKQSIENDYSIQSDNSNYEIDSEYSYSQHDSQDVNHKDDNYLNKIANDWFDDNYLYW